VPSSRERQRKLARAKVERQIARRAHRARRRRQIYAGSIGGVAVLLVLFGGLWIGGVFKHKKAPASTTTTASQCNWKKADLAGNKNLKDTGTPPANGNPKTGTETMTITTNLGVVTVSLDLAKAPCTAASFKYLASKGYFNNTICHRLVESGDNHILQCGDPSGTGQGGPGYTFADEYVPPIAQPSAGTDPSAAPASTAVYPAGSVAMANAGAGTNGSQFFIVYKDSTYPPNYTLFGQVTAGLPIVQDVGKAGDDGTSDAGGGKPKKAVNIQTITVGEPTAAAPSTAPTGSPAPTARSSVSPTPAT
jgi:peptidyl-prolyl cis-trans isomerase B (cyclophilin B)